MNRKSLGADIYSPIRFNASFNDSSLNADGSISEFCSGIINPGSKTDSENLSKLASDEDSCELQREKPARISKTADQKNKSGNSSLVSLRNGPSPIHSYKSNVSPSDLEDSVFSTSPIINELVENGRITVRRSLRSKEKEDATKQSKERSTTKRSSNKSLFPSKFVTVRGDSRSRRSGEHKNSSCKSNVDILPTHSETLESFNIEVPTASSSIVLSDKSKGSSNSSEDKSKGNSNFFENKSKGSSNSSEDSSRLLGMNSCSSVNCSTQTVLTLTELHAIIKKSMECSEKKEGPVSSLVIKKECINNTLKKSSDMEVLVSQPAQIQANIMEKLVRDIVDPECCEIRQILYLQHLANSKLLFKILDELEEGRSKELSKENQQLRIENQQLRIENQQIRNENIQLRKTHNVREYNC